MARKKDKKKEAPAIDREALEAAAEFLQNLMGLDPPIETDVEDDKLTTDVIEAAAELQPRDKIPADVLKTLTDIGTKVDGVIPPPKEKPKAKNGKAKAKGKGRGNVANLKPKEAHPKRDDIKKLWTKSHKGEKGIKVAKEIHEKFADVSLDLIYRWIATWAKE